MSADEDTMMAKEVATIYARFQWLEKVYAHAKVDGAHVKDIKDIGMDVIRNASAYLVQVDGNFTEVSRRVVRKPLWPGTVFVDEHKEVDIFSAIQQANSAVYVVLVQDRYLTIFDNV